MLEAHELRSIRAALDLSQPAFAAEIGYKEVMLRNWESERRAVPLRAELAIEGYLARQGRSRGAILNGEKP
jgi:DNA-binding transcriptional regulator YiaG